METNNKGVNQNGWNEYSKWVVKELERLDENIEKVVGILNDIKIQISRLDSVKEELHNLKTWKGDLSEVASVSHLKQMKRDVDSLNTFKTVATTVWAIVQVLFVLFTAFYNK